MKILLRASASPRAARPLRPTSVPIKLQVEHRNLNTSRKNLRLTSLLLIIIIISAGGPGPVTTSNLKKNPVTYHRTLLISCTGTPRASLSRLRFRQTYFHCAPPVTVTVSLLESYSSKMWTSELPLRPPSALDWKLYRKPLRP